MRTGFIDTASTVVDQLFYPPCWNSPVQNPHIINVTSHAGFTSTWARELGFSVQTGT